MNSSIDIDKNARFIGYYYGVNEVLALNFSPQPGMFFVNGETNSMWVWDPMIRMWVDTNRVDSGLKGMLTDSEGNTPADFVPQPKAGIKESYFYVAECDDVDLNEEAIPRTITFTYFKNGASSVSITIRKTSIITLFWNGDYWEASSLPMNVDWDLYAKKTEVDEIKSILGDKGIPDENIPLSWTRGYHYNAQGGEITLTTSWGIASVDISGCTGKTISIKATTHRTGVGASNAKNLFVDSSGAVIEVWDQEQGVEIEKTVPANAKYLKLSNYFDYNGEDINTNPYVMIKGSVGNTGIISQIEALEENILAIEEGLYGNGNYLPDENIPLTWTRGYHYNAQGGEVALTTSWGIVSVDISGYIGRTISIKATTHRTGVGASAAKNLFVDSSGAVIEVWDQEQGVEIEKTVPANAKYLKLSNYFDYNGEDINTNPSTKISSSGDYGVVKEIEDIKNTIEELKSNSSGGGGTINNHWENKTWYAYGTSLTSIQQGKYVPVVQGLGGFGTVVNRGIPGGGIINSSANIKSSVMNTTDGKLEADLITLECLANDRTAPFGEVTDTDGTTFLGALSECIKYLQENTTAQIVVMTSMMTRDYTPTSDYTIEYYRRIGKMQELCNLYDVYYIDPNKAIGNYRRTDDYYVDNVHHTALGGKVFGEYIWSKLKDIPLWK